ncbi:hypothetical protein [Corynebacterium camporealensis]
MSALPQYFSSTKALRLISELSSTDHSTIYLVESEWSGDKQYLEVFSPNTVSDPEAATQELQGLSHAGIAKYASSGQSPDGEFYVLRQAAGGQTLADSVGSSNPWQESLSDDATNSILNDLADTTAYLEKHYAQANLEAKQVALEGNTPKVISVLPKALQGDPSKSAAAFSALAGTLAPSFAAAAALDKARTGSAAPQPEPPKQPSPQHERPQNPFSAPAQQSSQPDTRLPMLSQHNPKSSAPRSSSRRPTTTSKVATSRAIIFSRITRPRPSLIPSRPMRRTRATRACSS